MNKFQQQIAKINATFGATESPDPPKKNSKPENTTQETQAPSKNPGKKGRQWYYFKKKKGA